MQRMLVYLMVVGLFLAACASPAGPVSVPTEVGPTPAEPTPAQPTSEPTTETPTEAPEDLPAANAAVQALAALLGIDPSLITVAEVEAVEWNDSCLGIVRIDAICAQGIVPGYRLSLAVEGRQFEYHTNEDGSAFALAPAAIEAEVEPAVAAVVKALAQALGLPEYRVNVVSVEAVEWPDSCLGVTRIDALCAQGIVPGYRLVVEAVGDVSGQLYEYHTNQDGSALTLAPVSPSAEAQTAAQAAVAALVEALGLTADQISLVSVAPREWPDACLGVSVPGMGCAQVITPGFNVVLEANEGQLYEYHTDAAGTSVQPASVALNWQRNGGIAGFCDALVVYRSGEIVAHDCKSENVAQATLAGTLAEADVAQFNEWLAQYGAVSVVQDDGAVADSMAVNLNFTGTGTAQPSEAEQQALVEWAQNLYNQLQPAS